MNIIQVKLTFIEETLGLSSSNPDMQREFIASKAPDAPSMEEEIEAIGADEVFDRAMTVFPRVNDQPIVWDYQIKGMFKDFCKGLARAGGTKSSQLTAYKSVIDTLVFVNPRAIVLEIPNGLEMGESQRPIRVQTPKGERVALASSETCPAGTTMTFEVCWYDLKKNKTLLGEAIREWFDYGVLRGFSQWRNSGKGRFRWEEI